MKYFNVSREEIERELQESGSFMIEGEIEVDDGGEQVMVAIDLCINWKDGPSGWSVALLLHKERIDGIDYEQEYPDLDGNKQSGWHRHVWDESKQSAKYQKRVINDIDGVETMRDFLIRSLSAMDITLNQVDHGNYELPFN